MAFTYSTTTTGIAVATTNQAANLPATVDANDLLLVVYSWLGAATNNIATPPSGYTEIMAQVNRDGLANLAVYGKVADGSEDGGTATAVLDSNATGSHIVIRVTAASWFQTIGSVEAGVANVQAGTAPDPPSLTASWGAEDNLFIAIGAAADDDVDFTVAPTNYVDLENIVSGAGTNAGCSCGAAFLEVTADATDNPGTFTLASSESWVANTLVVRPAAAAAPPVGTLAMMGIGR